MKIILHQKFRSYKKDCIKHFVFKILNKPFVILILIYIVIALLLFLNKRNYIIFFPDIIGMLTFSLGIGILGMIVYSVFFLLRAIRKVNNEVNTLYEGEVRITINDDCIVIQKGNNDEYYYKTNWNQIKELIVISGTAYLIPVNKNDFMIRINKKEIITGDFEKIIEFVKSKWKRIRRGI